MAGSTSWSTTPAYTPFLPLEEITEEAFHQQFNVNVLGLLLTTQAAVKHMGEGGSIINIGSVVTRITPPGSAIYTGTKGAVGAITGVLARELGPRKIRVNAVNPGMVETEGTHTAGFIGSDFHKDAIAKTPLGRIGQPDDVASIVTFLASDDSALDDRRGTAGQRRKPLSPALGAEFRSARGASPRGSRRYSTSYTSTMATPVSPLAPEASAV